MQNQPLKPILGAKTPTDLVELPHRRAAFRRCSSAPCEQDHRDKLSRGQDDNNDC